MKYGGNSGYFIKEGYSVRNFLLEDNDGIKGYKKVGISEWI